MGFAFFIFAFTALESFADSPDAQSVNDLKIELGSTPDKTGDVFPWGLLAGHRLDEIWGADVYSLLLPKMDIWSFNSASSGLQGLGFTYYLGGRLRRGQGGFHVGANVTEWWGVHNQIQFGPEFGYGYRVLDDMEIGVDFSTMTAPGGRTEGVGTLGLRYWY